MNKLILLCGLLAGLYLSVQAEESLGWYARASCGISVEANSFIGFGYAASEPVAKESAKNACASSIPESYRDEITNFQYSTRKDKPGLFVCGATISDDFTLEEDSEMNAAISLQDILRKKRNHPIGRVYCYNSSSGMSKFGSVDGRGDIRQDQKR